MVRFSSLRSRDLFLLCIVSVVTMAISCLWRRPPIDDAYITYRYAAQLVAGNGLVYNVGEWVLGTTTPLWAAILAIASWFGCDIEGASIVGGALAALATAIFFLVAIPRDATITFRALWAVALMLYYPLAVVRFSGMETAVYTAVVGVGLFCFGCGRITLGALCAVVATLLRPDGALLLVAGVVSIPLQKIVRSTLVAFALYGVLLIPVALLGLSVYGAVWPHSVATKRLLYPVSYGENILFFFEALSQTPVDALVLCLGGAGLLLVARDTALRPFVVWGALYGAGIIASGVKPLFFWYFGPLWFLFLTVGIEGIRRAFATVRICGIIPLVGGAALVGLALVCVDLLQRVMAPDPVLRREDAYRAIVSEYAAQIGPTTPVLLGEVGILGYGFMHAPVIDSCGLVSPGVTELIRNARQQIGPYTDIYSAAPWLQQTVERFDPAWIIGARDRMGLSRAEGEGWFADRYERVKVWAPEVLGGIALYRHRP